MAQLSEAIASYHRLLGENGYCDFSWAQELQDRMRDQGLMDSGRPVAPILRPQFILRCQLDCLTGATQRLASILDRVETIVLESPTLLNRLQVLPAEKLLASIPAGYARCSVIAGMDVKLQNGSLSICGYQTCKPKALAYSQLLADLFLDLSIVKSFKRGRYKLSKVGQPAHLTRAVLDVWKKWGGVRPPHVAVVEFRDAFGAHSNEGQLMAALFAESGLVSRLVSPDQLTYSNAKLRTEDLDIDVVFRRFAASEFLARFDLSHPLLAAYRNHAFCMVNSLRSEIGCRRSLFELLTDGTLAASLSCEDRQLIEAHVPWTRVVVGRKTDYKGREVDLLEFIRKNRQMLNLRPDQDTLDHRSYIGAGMTQTGWEGALRDALRGSYVVQERKCAGSEAVPIFRYGELQMREAEVRLHPQMLNGKLRGACAALETFSCGFATPLATAPVLLLESA